MSTCNRYRVTWNFPNGGPGVSTFYGSGTSVGTDLNGFFTAIKTRIPIGVTCDYSGEVESFTVETGELVDASSVETPWSVAGTGTGAWAAGTGASVRWLTGAVVRGHRVYGRTFLAPLNSFSYDSTGTLDSSALSEFRTAAGALIASTGSVFYVWSRPVPAPGGVGPAAPGVISPITGSSVRDVVAGLRSRRT
jgi:hypothetical protein